MLPDAELEHFGHLMRIESGLHRERQGLERLDQVKYAVLERNGEISIVPKSESD